MSNTVVGTVKDLTEEVEMRNPRTWTINLVFMTSRGVVIAPVIAPAKICFSRQGLQIERKYLTSGDPLCSSYQKYTTKLFF